MEIDMGEDSFITQRNDITFFFSSATLPGAQGGRHTAKMKNIYIFRYYHRIISLGVPSFKKGRVCRKFIRITEWKRSHTFPSEFGVKHGPRKGIWDRHSSPSPDTLDPAGGLRNEISIYLHYIIWLQLKCSQINQIALVARQKIIEFKDRKTRWR